MDNFENIKWNNENYTKFIKYLYSISDLKYAQFHGKLIKNNNIIGIKTPILKQIAKSISKGDYLSFIKLNKHKYYEEVVIHGLIITYIKDYKLAISLFDEYINYIESWASCDIVVCNFKIIKKNLNETFVKIKQYINNSNYWINRVGIVLLLTYYLNDDYIDKVLNISESINSDEYYVKMANAWLISICLVKYYDKTYNFLLNAKLDDWTYNKALQKAIESSRIKDKNILKNIKKKLLK